jgi:type II secretory pathway component PulJ
MKLGISSCMRNPNANGFLVLLAMVALAIIAVIGLAMHQLSL